MPARRKLTDKQVRLLQLLDDVTARIERGEVRGMIVCLEIEGERDGVTSSGHFNLEWALSALRSVADDIADELIDDVTGDRPGAMH